LINIVIKQSFSILRISTLKSSLPSDYQHQRQYESAINLLHPYLFNYSNDSSLIGAFSENSRLLAESYIHHHQSQKAVAVIDTALVYDVSNRSLLYTKGLAYEALHKYDSAHFYEKFYQPSLTEAKDFEIHLEQLEQKSNTNFITVSYLTSKYGDNDKKTSVSSISYLRKRTKNTISFQLNYAGRGGGLQTDEDNYAPGGTGIQIQGQWEHTFDKNWNMMGNIAVSTKYFPRLASNIQIDKTVKRGWILNLHSGYRRINSYSLTFAYDAVNHVWNADGWKKSTNNMINIGTGIHKTWTLFALSGKLDAISYASSLRYSTVVNTYYYPLQSRILSISAVAAISNAPQTEILDAALSGTFDKTNTTTGIGINYQLIRNISVSVNGTWEHLHQHRSQPQSYTYRDNRWHDI
jgi:hypothetical protein